MTIAAIYAVDLNNALGKDNKLIWHLPADLKFFKETTMGCPIIMGRKTYESIGRLLPGRRNIIITRNSDYRVHGAEIYTTVEHAIESCRQEDTVFVIGGAEIFKLTEKYTDVIYRTLIKEKFEADTFMEPINALDFKMTWEECHGADEKNKYNFCFQKWERITQA